MSLDAVAILLLAVSAAACPPGCFCPMTTVTCPAQTITFIPEIENDVQTLIIRNNQFTNPILEQRNFTNMANLEKLTLKGCGIEAISYNTFVYMTKLTYLDLSLNNIRAIGEGSLTGLRLDYLFLDDNPSIQLPTTAFSGMTTGILSLQNCDLREVHPEIFTPMLGRLRRLFLQGNKIERFPKPMLEVFKQLELMRIYDNPLICDCESRWLKQFYDERRETSTIRDNNLGSDQEPRCSSPSHIIGQFFNRLSLADFSCNKPTLAAGISFTNDKGVLTCTSRGSPLPTVSWHRPNGVITESVPRPNLAINKNEIELLADEPNVQGQYKCIASNEGGNISLSVNVDWPFGSAHIINGDKVTCPPAVAGNTKEIEIIGGSEEKQTNMFSEKYFTLVDLICAVFGTFVGTLIITIVVLHFCVYRRKAILARYSPSMSEYSGSTDDKPPYPPQLTLQTHMHNRPLPIKPYHKIYDEHHYMSTNLDERDQFLHMSQHMQSNGNTSHGSASHSSMASPCEACVRTYNTNRSRVS